ncbi:hypothetical protein Tco_1225576, partial [Tanacetum coccineum]
MAERTMEELLRAPTEGYGEAIVLPKINADHFEIKTNLLQLVQANPFYGRESENPHAHINSFKRITSTLRFRNVSNDVIKLMMFPYSLEGAAKTYEAWERFKELLRACPHHGFTELTQVDTFYNGLNENEQDSLNVAAGGKLLICEDYALELLGFSNSSGGNPTPTFEPFTFEFILEEIEAYFKDDSISPEIDHADCDPEKDICLIEKLLNNDPFQLPPMDLKQSKVTEAKSSIEGPPELELKDLPSHLEYAFLEENDKLPVIIAKGLKNDEKDALLK